MMNQADVPTQVASKQHWMDICATETLLPLSGWNKVECCVCMYIMYGDTQYMYAMQCFILYYYHWQITVFLMVF